VQLVQGSPITVSKRSITPETFEKWKYQEGELANGEKVHLANHIVNGQIIGQKIRTAKKDFKVFGEMDALYGRWLWGKGGKRVIVTEGEIDALSVSQAQGNKWPVVSVPNGAAGAEKAFKKSIDWLTSYDEVVIAFDNDEPGTLAAKACAAILPPGKAKIATLPLKDANEMLKAGREDELIRCLWNATEYRPDGIVALKDVVEDALRPVEIGRPWPFPSLTSATYGRRLREVYTLGAGTGVGKTDVLTECIAFDLNTLSLNVGVLFLEQDKRETVQRLAGKLAGKRFHVPDGTWSEGELRGAIRELESKGALYLYDNFGATDWATIRDRIEYMVQALGCEHIYLDHLTALAAAEDDERKALETIMSELAGQAKRLNCCIHLVSHLSTPDGTPHEEGGRVMIRHFKGSRAIGFWSYFMFGLERDQQDDDESMRNVTTFRVLKDRYTGQATGKTFYLKYDHETGRLSEWTPDNFAASDNEPQDF
jgi:twinkle protein